MNLRKRAENVASYVDRNPMAIIGTINPDGTPHGAVVYVCSDDREHKIIYFLTKTETIKRRNVAANNRVSITIVNPDENSTLQASGEAFEVDDPGVIDAMMVKLTKRQIRQKGWLPPITKIHAGAYVLIGVRLTEARLAVFEDKPIGDPHLFTQLI